MSIRLFFTVFFSNAHAQKCHRLYSTPNLPIYVWHWWKLTYVRRFVYARRQEYQFSVGKQITCVRKDKNMAPGAVFLTLRKNYYLYHLYTLWWRSHWRTQAWCHIWWRPLRSACLWRWPERCSGSSRSLRRRLPLNCRASGRPQRTVIGRDARHSGWRNHPLPLMIGREDASRRRVWPRWPWAVVAHAQ